MGFRSGLPQPHSSIYLIPLWLATLKRPSRVPGTACRAGTIATPPKKRGGMRSQKEVRCGIPLFARMTGRYRPHLSLREGLEQPPFPSRFIVSDRFSPSRVRFAASRPGRLRADPKDALLTRGKGGFGPWGARAGCQAHDKGYYHSCCQQVLMPDYPTLIQGTDQIAAKNILAE